LQRKGRAAGAGVTGLVPNPSQPSRDEDNEAEDGGDEEG
jgi:hypothetical protein